MSMADKKPQLFQLKSPRNVRSTLTKLFRMRYNGQIEGDVIKDLINTAKVMLDHDKYARDLKLDERMETLENYIRGENGTLIDAKELNSPLIVDLKKKLAAAEKTNNELSGDLLTARQKANELEAEMELIQEHGQEKAG